IGTMVLRMVSVRLISPPSVHMPVERSWMQFEPYTRRRQTANGFARVLCAPPRADRASLGIGRDWRRAAAHDNAEFVGIAGMAQLLLGLGRLELARPHFG